MLIVLPFLGGSVIWYLGGAHELDIEGIAPRHDNAAGMPLPAQEWKHYGGDAGGHRFSKAAQINLANVAELAVAWRYQTGDLENRSGLMRRSASQATPILVEDALVFCTPFNEVIALDPGSGEERWRFDPEINLNQRPANQFLCRGVSYWRDDQASGSCSSRIFMGTNDARLIALDAKTGVPCGDFGEGGEVRIDPGMALSVARRVPDHLAAGDPPQYGCGWIGDR